MKSWRIRLSSRPDQNEPMGGRLLDGFAREDEREVFAAAITLHQILVEWAFRLAGLARYVGRHRCIEIVHVDDLAIRGADGRDKARAAVSLHRRNVVGLHQGMGQLAAV